MVKSTEVMRRDMTTAVEGRLLVWDRIP